MSRLRIRHETVYRFETPTGFGAWRLMLRPIDTHAVRLLEASLDLSPEGELRWVHDAYGNSICRFSPTGEASELRIVNNLLVERYPPVLTYDNPQSFTPLAYAELDRFVLAPFMLPDYLPGEERFQQWAAIEAPFIGEPSLAYVQRLCGNIAGQFSYAAREAEGVQTPAETVARGAGACRDFAVLMIETLRRYGFAARFASGYLFDPDGDARGAGATHAWCEAFLPELGWLDFDPTNGIAGSADLIRVASTRTPQEAAPVSGTTLTPVSAYLDVTVKVELAD